MTMLESFLSHRSALCESGVTLIDKMCVASDDGHVERHGEKRSVFAVCVACISESNRVDQLHARIIKA